MFCFKCCHVNHRSIFGVFIWIICVLYSGVCQGQSKLCLSFEPNLMLGNRKINAADESRDYLSSNNTIGTGLNLGFVTNLRGNFCLMSSVHVFNLRNSVNLDLVKSGFSSSTNSEYDKNQSYSMGYINGIGIALAAGYNFKLPPNKIINAALGFHAHAAKIKPGAGLLVTSANYIGMPSGIPIYEEQLTGSGSRVTLFGMDLAVNYNLIINRKSCFIGLHYATNLGGKIRGKYVTFPNFTVSHSGTFELSTNYLGLTVGFALPIGKSNNTKLKMI